MKTKPILHHLLHIHHHIQKTQITPIIIVSREFLFRITFEIGTLVNIQLTVNVSNTICLLLSNYLQPHHRLNIPPILMKIMAVSYDNFGFYWDITQYYFVNSNFQVIKILHVLWHTLMLTTIKQYLLLQPIKSKLYQFKQESNLQHLTDTVG